MNKVGKLLFVVLSFFAMTITSCSFPVASNSSQGTEEKL